MKRYDKRLEYKTKKAIKEVKKIIRMWSGAMEEAYMYEILNKEWVIYEQRQKGLYMFSLYNKKYR